MGCESSLYASHVVAETILTLLPSSLSTFGPIYASRKQGSATTMTDRPMTASRYVITHHTRKWKLILVNCRTWTLSSTDPTSVMNF
jgi:hypothetical protein